MEDKYYDQDSAAPAPVAKNQIWFVTHSDQRGDELSWIIFTNGDTVVTADEIFADLEKESAYGLGENEWVTVAGPFENLPADSFEEQLDAVLEELDEIDAEEEEEEEPFRMSLDDPRRAGRAPADTGI